ncbi:unnamed protein product [Caenorhabditis auriculariae]|uniref:RRM domain-containing protein n=1 Tax=Caenorhabditis auriculariae TaxID=2777116 RepID=A0A8S1GRF3_9PELO|nr:unnamed protein product [Caenorhabditis auriculariae]
MSNSFENTLSNIVDLVKNPYFTSREPRPEFRQPGPPPAPNYEYESREPQPRFENRASAGFPNKYPPVVELQINPTYQGRERSPASYAPQSSYSSMPSGQPGSANYTPINAQQASANFQPAAATAPQSAPQVPYDYNAVGFDTSSVDPSMVRSRVFVGNLVRANTNRTEIIDLFRPLGKLLSVSYFAPQGYGFVQYLEPASAEKAVQMFNGTHWKGSLLDVHLATLAPNRPRKGEILGKRAMEVSMIETDLLEKRNREFAIGDKTNNEMLKPHPPGFKDTLICGSCRFVTSDFEDYKSHRVAGCDKGQDSDEKKHRLKCNSCGQIFTTGWAVLSHLADFHKMTLNRKKSSQLMKRNPAMSTSMIKWASRIRRFLR